MEEATEICKLRLFLKLAAQVEPDPKKDNFGIEPLPDIDFNIRAGNTLGRLCDRGADGEGRHGTARTQKTPGRAIQSKAAAIAKLFEDFQKSQRPGRGGWLHGGRRRDLRERLHDPAGRIGQIPGQQYGKVGKESLAAWRKSAQPFHWFIEFYSVMSSGGFDVIIGNPPYVEYSKVRGSYDVSAFQSTSSGNLYGLILERSYKLIAANGFSGLIVPLSLSISKRAGELRKVSQHNVWITCFDMRPSSLFEGVAQRLCILLSAGAAEKVRTLSTGGYRRWTSLERPFLMQMVIFTTTTLRQPSLESIPKFSTTLDYSIRDKVQGTSLNTLVDKDASPIYVHRIVRYFVKALDFVPLFVEDDGVIGKSDDYKEFHFSDDEKDSITSLLNSSLFYWFWRSYCDGFHCGYNDVFMTKYKSPPSIEVKQALGILQNKLMRSLRHSSAEKKIAVKTRTIRYQEFYPKLAKSII